MRFMRRGAETPERPIDEVYLAKALKLASFIHNGLNDEERRKVAFEIAKEAWRKLPSMAKEQGKRKYYLLKGQIRRSEDKDSEYRIKDKARYKITLKKINQFQFLVFKASEKVERAQEEGGSSVPLNQEEMLVRYLAYLVNYTVKQSSFYVNLGLCRFVYSYDAGEMETLYNFVTQESPNRDKYGEYFRKSKANVKQELEKRFGTRLHTVMGKRGEKHFQRVEEQEQFCDLLKQCLDEFQPWEVSCCLPARFNANDKLPMLRFDAQDDKDDDSVVELNRIHSLLHPDCFVKLVRAKGYDEPEKRLGLPLFFLSDNRTAG